MPENNRSLFADANVCVRPGEVVEVTIKYLGQDDHAATQVHGKARHVLSQYITMH